MPLRASIDLDRIVQATDRDDALRQACLCLDRDLEDLLGRVNAINLSEVVVEIDAVREVGAPNSAAPWNPDVFDEGLAVPAHMLVRLSETADASGAT